MQKDVKHAQCARCTFTTLQSMYKWPLFPLERPLGNNRWQKLYKADFHQYNIVRVVCIDVFKFICPKYLCDIDICKGAHKMNFRNLI